MLVRIIEAELRRVATQFPVVTVTGPRQSGKTTLVRHTFPAKPYLNLENPETRLAILEDPKGYLNRLQDGAVIDEVQHAPELMSYIQDIVDTAQTPGQFILTGSHQLQLHQAITQSLAGRSAILELLPLSLEEMVNSQIMLSLDEQVISGFYPAIYSKSLDPLTVYRSYVKTYVERDVRQLVNVKDLVNFQRFLQLAAGRIGSVLNTESLSNDVGVAHNTIKNWFSVLETSYVTNRLLPYYENFGKRIIKSPKLYFSDIGIASYLLGIESQAQMVRDRMRGFLFENLVFSELQKARTHRGKEPRIFYYRDTNQNEIDFIVKSSNRLIPIEVKSTSTFNPALLKNLKFFQKLVGTQMQEGFLVYAGEEEYRIGDFHIVNYRNIAQIVTNLT